jgi:hypothetical protein
VSGIVWDNEGKNQIGRYALILPKTSSAPPLAEQEEYNGPRQLARPTIVIVLIRKTTLRHDVPG